MQTGRDFTKDSRESVVILWCGLVDGILDQVVSIALTEPDCRAQVRSQRQRCRQNLRCFERN